MTRPRGSALDDVRGQSEFTQNRRFLDAALASPQRLPAAAELALDLPGAEPVALP